MKNFSDWNYYNERILLLLNLWCTVDSCLLDRNSSSKHIGISFHLSIISFQLLVSFLSGSKHFSFESEVYGEPRRTSFLLGLFETTRLNWIENDNERSHIHLFPFPLSWTKSRLSHIYMEFEAAISRGRLKRGSC